MLPEKPEPVLLGHMLNKVAGLGRMHTSQPVFSFSSLAKVTIIEHYNKLIVQ
jgi:hypothetical protein